MITGVIRILATASILGREVIDLLEVVAEAIIPIQSSVLSSWLARRWWLMADD
jgi:hypothetical protein